VLVPGARTLAGYPGAPHARSHSGFPGAHAARAPERLDDLDVSEPAQECIVCQQIRPRGAYDHEQDVFVCAGCQRDAKQFLEIQDDPYGDGVGRGRAGDGD
jgi:hypothetical protein